MNVDRRVAEDAQGLVWERRVKPKDALRAATALHRACPVLRTFDDHLTAKGADIPNLLIQQP